MCLLFINAQIFFLTILVIYFLYKNENFSFRHIFVHHFLTFSSTVSHADGSFLKGMAKFLHKLLRSFYAKFIYFLPQFAPWAWRFCGDSGLGSFYAVTFSLEFGFSREIFGLIVFSQWQKLNWWLCPSNSKFPRHFHGFLRLLKAGFVPGRVFSGVFWNYQCSFRMLSFWLGWYL